MTTLYSPELTFSNYSSVQYVAISILIALLPELIVILFLKNDNFYIYDLSLFYFKFFHFDLRFVFFLFHRLLWNRRLQMCFDNTSVNGLSKIVKEIICFVPCACTIFRVL